jgi:hypothetical protein
VLVLSDSSYPEEASLRETHIVHRHPK